ncbi:hypothetical protein [Vibrio parahaemolyticus]|nr:hypothetical protein [Vibrio parahaemolyticus]
MDQAQEVAQKTGSKGIAKTHQEDEKQHFLARKARKTKGFLVH